MAGAWTSRRWATTRSRAAMRRWARIIRSTAGPAQAAVRDTAEREPDLVSYTGRKTGMAYRQPVSCVHDGNVLTHADP